MMAVSIERYYRELTEGKRIAVGDSALLAFLRVLALPYAVLMRLRAGAYEAGLFRVRRLPRPVISVGNLTVGGTGKTPTAAMLAKYFLSRGKRVVLLSRGYGGTMQKRGGIVSDGRSILATPQEAGDEPYLLAATVPGLMVVVGADRYGAGLLAMERLAPDLFILDDGFQHLRLERDLNILLLDSRRPFGNGNLLPAGLLREPPSAAGRADLVMYTRCSDGDGRDPVPGKISCRSFHHLSDTALSRSGKETSFEELKGARGVAFAGIADPAPFFQDLEEKGLTLVKTIRFPDHCNYREREVAEILRVSAESRADYLITTEKDGVKLDQFREQLVGLHTVPLELWVADPGPLIAQLEKFL